MTSVAGGFLFWYYLVMSKIKVTLTDKYDLKKGGSVEHFEVGNWLMELVVEDFESELAFAKQGQKAYKAWYRWLKKNRKKYKTP